MKDFYHLAGSIGFVRPFMLTLSVLQTRAIRSMPHQYTGCGRGRGASGLRAALALASQGYNVAVYERATP